MVNKKDQMYYKCYSYRQYKWLATHGFKVLNSDVNERTGNRFWLYAMSDELSESLTKYSEVYTKNN